VLSDRKAPFFDHNASGQKKFSALQKNFAPQRDDSMASRVMQSHDELRIEILVQEPEALRELRERFFSPIRKQTRHASSGALKRSIDMKSQLIVLGRAIEMCRWLQEVFSL
jgi:hypothetical protein